MASFDIALNGFDALPDDRKCTLCGRHISGAEWMRLKLIGFLVIPRFEDDPGEVLEMRNDTCGTTMTRPTPFGPDAFEHGVQVEMRRIKDRKLAESVAADHLESDPSYYQR